MDKQTTQSLFTPVKSKLKFNKALAWLLGQREDEKAQGVYKKINELVSVEMPSGKIWKANVSSVGPSSERMINEGLKLENQLSKSFTVAFRLYHLSFIV